jgi:hypothetical protein
MRLRAGKRIEMKVVKRIVHTGILVTVVTFFVVLAYASFRYEPNWDVQENAVRDAAHPLAGFWKQNNCEDPWGLAIGPATPELYYVAYCGPGGCADIGASRPYTNIVNDPGFEVLDEDRMKYLSSSGWSTLVRCSGR